MTQIKLCPSCGSWLLIHFDGDKKSVQKYFAKKSAHSRAGSTNYTDLCQVRLRPVGWDELRPNGQRTRSTEWFSQVTKEITKESRIVDGMIDQPSLMRSGLQMGHIYSVLLTNIIVPRHACHGSLARVQYSLKSWLQTVKTRVATLGWFALLRQSDGKATVLYLWQRRRRVWRLPWCGWQGCCLAIYKDAALPHCQPTS